MAGAQSTAPTLLASEVEFIAGEEAIEVLPAVTLGTLHLIADDYGPLVPNRKVALPLWMALQLRRAKYCRIVAPSWMAVGVLEDLLREEVEHRDDFAPLPFHYIEVATMLLNAAPEDISDGERVRILVQNIREQRMAKVQSGLVLIDGNPLKLNNVGHLELNEMRPFLLGVLDRFVAMNDVEAHQQGSAALRSTMAALPSSSYNSSEAPLFNTL